MREGVRIPPAYLKRVMKRLLWLLFCPCAFTHRLRPKRASALECQAPSLPAGAFHVVIAGFAADTCFEYLYDLGLTNAHVFVYRREGADTTAVRTWRGRCGVTVTEALLLPNSGYEGAAFYDYVSSQYNTLPLAAVFLHGHGPFGSIYTDGATVAGRTVAYYRAVAHGEEIASHMVTLTKPGRSGSIEGWWNRRLQWAKFPLVSDDNDPTCAAILDKHGALAATDFLESCCGSFIIPGNSLRKYPRAMYHELASYLLRATDSKHAAVVCFEYVAVRVFGEKSIASQPRVREWYASVPHTKLEHTCY